jgi:predicted component of type VI protein secretion system
MFDPSKTGDRRGFKIRKVILLFESRLNENVHYELRPNLRKYNSLLKKIPPPLVRG